MHLTLITFGYEVAPPPADCAWVADVRDIDAGVIDGLWQYNGLDQKVAAKVLDTPAAERWLAAFTNELDELQDGDRVAVGCSIGMHRSVAVGQAMATIARDAGWQVTVQNRDLELRRDTAGTLAPMERTTMAYETRALSSGSLSFTNEGGKPRIDGRAILFDSWSADLGGFRERMLPNSVELESDLVALFDHATDKVLGRTSAGTMEVRSDSKGVAFTAYPPATTWAADLRVSMERGDIKGCSYRMYVDEDRWYVQDGMVCRDVVRARVSELTVTSMPAYPETTAEARDRASQLAKAANVEERAGRVISDANEQVLKSALVNIEAASDMLEAVITQVDPTFNEDNLIAEDPAYEEMPAAPNAGTVENSGLLVGGSLTEADRTSAGAAETTQRQTQTFVMGFGFITNPERK